MNSPQKKVCFVIPHHWSAAYAGSELQIKYLLDSLCEDNDYHLFYLCKYVHPDFHTHDYDIIKIKEKRLIKKFRFYFDSFELLRALNKLEPDIIYQRHGCAYTWICAYYAKKAKLRMIFHISSDVDINHSDLKASGSSILEFVDGKAVRYALKNVSHIIGQTDDQNDLLKKEMNRSCDLVVPNFHPRPESRIGKKDKPVHVVWISNLKPVKRPELFVMLAERFQKEKDVIFFLIGKKYNDHLTRKIELRAAGLKNFSFLGERPNEEVNEILSYSHILVNTSKYEGLPNTFIQAWMHKVPVVSLNVDPDGYLLKYHLGYHSRRFDQMENDIRTLIKDKGLRAEMGERAQRFAWQRFAMDNIVKIKKFIHQIAEGNKRKD